MLKDSPHMKISQHFSQPLGRVPLLNVASTVTAQGIEPRLPNPTVLFIEEIDFIYLFHTWISYH